MSAGATRPVPAFAHIVVVIEENHAADQVIGNPDAPYLASLARSGVQLTQSYGVTHPSEPNYLALFSGSTQGLTSDACPRNFSGTNLGAQLIGAGFSFKGYSESMPSNGYTGCTSGEYARKHNSWVDFSNVPAASNLTYASFPSTFTNLPTVAFVTPNLCDDMHDCSVATGDTWLRTHLDPYAQWAKTHNSLLIVTFDEDDSASGNNIYTSFVGAQVKIGSYSERVTHYTVLRTIEAWYGLAGINNAASLSPILDAFV